MFPTDPQAEGTGDGSHESNEVKDNERAKARASSKGKKDAADLKSSKKRAPPEGANTSKAAKKTKTSSLAYQVCRGRSTARTKVSRTDCPFKTLNVACSYWTSITN